MSHRPRPSRERALRQLDRHAPGQPLGPNRAIPDLVRRMLISGISEHNALMARLRSTSSTR